MAATTPSMLAETDWLFPSPSLASWFSYMPFSLATSLTGPVSLSGSLSHSAMAISFQIYTGRCAAKDDLEGADVHTFSFH